MIHVLAIVTAQPGKRDQVLAEFRKNQPNVLAEAGCVEYFPVIDAAGAGPIQAPVGPETFIVIERWASMAALQAHAAAPHMAEYGRRVKDLVAQRTIHVLTGAL